ncbi:MAG TPA: hypothetical protein VKJ45_09060 [Blastocatellia bacterium]|nr:hypothetical protein [Blastocatellia bacterium]
MTKGAPAEYPDARGTDSAIAAEGDPDALRSPLPADRARASRQHNRNMLGKMESAGNRPLGQVTGTGERVPGCSGQRAAGDRRSAGF